MSEESTSPLSPAVFHVLLALAEGPLHGYGIMKRVQAESGLKMGPGTIYGALQRLSEAGWVDESQDPEPADARRGKVFSLTAPGTAALDAEARRITRLAGLEGVRRLAYDGAGQ